MWYDTTVLSWQIRASPCGYVIASYMTFLHGLATCVIIFAIDTFTFLCLRRKIKELHKDRESSASQIKILKDNIRLYIQGCMSAGLLILALTSFHFFSRFASTRLEKAATNTFSWQIAHILDGVILITFNKSLRDAFLGGMKTLKKRTTYIRSLP
ncbi:hypothetical protein OESDEN_04727 [Oesophagostomum dentatum]|uniref:7TM GPCR serpentine receptor class x (Srx) domain-containing protein n=1 Tax=Oesophagostomum dentatum TaxID=61180 RepID=A0A0B1TIT2_OESDE|nr:hypothetical protein OESDEN_04727 [Oesophagostomum dentatum]